MRVLRHSRVHGLDANRCLRLISARTGAPRGTPLPLSSSFPGRAPPERLVSSSSTGEDAIADAKARGSGTKSIQGRAARFIGHNLEVMRPRRE